MIRSISVRGKWRLVLRHESLALLRGDHFEQVAFLRSRRNDRPIAAFTAFEHELERSHHVATASLGWLVAALTLGLKNRTDLFVVADFLFLARACIGLSGFASSARLEPLLTTAESNESRHGPRPGTSTYPFLNPHLYLLRGLAEYEVLGHLGP